MNSLTLISIFPDAVKIKALKKKKHFYLKYDYVSFFLHCACLLRRLLYNSGEINCVRPFRDRIVDKLKSLILLFTPDRF